VNGSPMKLKSSSSCWYKSDYMNAQMWILDLLGRCSMSKGRVFPSRCMSPGKPNTAQRTECSSDRALWYRLFISYQLNAQNFFIHITLHSSKCFEQYYAHPQEVKLYVYSIWYRHSLWVDVVAVHGHHVHS